MRLRIYRFFSAFLMVGIIFVAALLFVLIVCNAKTYTFVGNTVYQENEIKRLVVTERYDTNVIIGSIMSYIRPKKGIPFVSRVRMKPTGLNSVKVEITEKKLFGVSELSDGRYLYYDSAYNVCEVSERLVEGVKTVELPELTKEPEVGKKLPVDDGTIKSLEILDKELPKREVAVDNTKLSDDGSIVLYKGNIEIRLGQRTNLAEKIQRLPYILPTIENQSGILHVEDFSEENTDIVFEKT